MNVAGIDYSTRAVDIVVISDDGPPTWLRYELQGKDAFDRARNVAVAMPSAYSVVWDDVAAVGIEHPGGKFGTGDMLRIQGAILARLRPSMLVEPWPPAKWRKAVGLPGNATKDEAAAHSILEGGGYDNDWPQDAFDAHCIALATRQAITTTQAA